MYEDKHVSKVLKKIMQSMKTKERSCCVVKSEYFNEVDPEYVAERGIIKDLDLIMDIDMKGLVRVDDLYRD